MKYYQWKGRFIDTEKQMIWKGNAEFKNSKTIKFSLGQQIEEDVQNTRFLIDWLAGRSQKGYLTDYMRIGGIFGIVITQKSVEILQKAGVNNIQAFDLEIIDEKHDKVYTDYKIVNIIGLCDAVDYDKSELAYTRKGTLIAYDKLVLDESKIPNDLLIFRLEKFKPIVIIHEKIKQAIEEAGLTGFVIEPTYK